VYIGFDFEFLEEQYSLRPISIGLAAEDGRKYYAVYRNLPQAEVWDHIWLRNNVVPQLPLREDKPLDGWRTGWLDVYHEDVKHHDDIAAGVKQFINETPRPTFVGNCDACDFTLLGWLFGNFVSKNRPGKMKFWSADIQQWAWHLGINDDAYPKQADIEHHALNDAEWNLETMLWLDEIAATRGLSARYVEHE